MANSHTESVHRSPVLAPIAGSGCLLDDQLLGRTTLNSSLRGHWRRVLVNSEGQAGDCIPEAEQNTPAQPLSSGLGQWRFPSPSPTGLVTVPRPRDIQSSTEIPSSPQRLSPAPVIKQRSNARDPLWPMGLRSYSRQLQQRPDCKHRPSHTRCAALRKLLITNLTVGSRLPTTATGDRYYHNLQGQLTVHPVQRDISSAARDRWG